MFADRAHVGTSDTQVSLSVQLSMHCRLYSKQALAVHMVSFDFLLRLSLELGR